MSEFFLELFSEEIPSSLQKSLREELLNSFIREFNEKSISFKNVSFSYEDKMTLNNISFNIKNLNLIETPI